MGIWHLKAKRKASGGKVIPARKKKKYELGREPTKTQIGDVKAARLKSRGFVRKISLISSNVASVSDPATRKVVKAKIIKIVENRANPQYVKQGIITRGAVLETDMGKVVVTSKPGQHGVINAKKI